MLHQNKLNLIRINLTQPRVICKYQGKYSRRDNSESEQNGGGEEKLRQNRRMQICLGNLKTTGLLYTDYPKGIISLQSSSSKNNLLVASFRSFNHQLAFLCGQIAKFNLRVFSKINLMCSHGAHDSQNWFYKDLRQTVLIKVRAKLATLIN